MRDDGGKFPLQRQGKILEMLKTRESMTVRELSETLKVSLATIRRDLERLQRMGLLQRVHGGAVLKEKVAIEPDYAREKERFLPEKRAIARIAAQLVENNDVIFLESSTTVLQMVEFLKDKNNLTVITNSLDIAQELRDSHLDLFLIGGRWRRKTNSLVGTMADLSLSQMNFDKAFIGVSALDFETGITTPSLEEAQTKKSIIKASNKVIALCDHSKFGKKNFAFVAPLTSIDILITDNLVKKEDIENLERLGVQVMLAEVARHKPEEKIMADF